MTSGPLSTAPCDGMIEAARFTLAVLDGDPDPGELSYEGLAGLGRLVIGTLLASAALQSIDGYEAQMAHVRDVLNAAIAGASLLALDVESGTGDG